jgi:hypothetical protein
MSPIGVCCTACASPHAGAAALRGEAGVEFGLRQRAGAHEDLAEAHAVLGQLVDQLEVFADLRVRRQDAQRAVVADEVEDLLDLRLLARVWKSISKPR